MGGWHCLHTRCVFEKTTATKLCYAKQVCPLMPKGQGWPGHFSGNYAWEKNVDPLHRTYLGQHTWWPPVPVSWWSRTTFGKPINTNQSYKLETSCRVTVLNLGHSPESSETKTAHGDLKSSFISVLFSLRKLACFSLSGGFCVALCHHTEGERQSGAPHGCLH